jgi:NAD-dependent deacetylase
MSIAYKIVKQADIIIIVGTSLQVYPAANLKDYCENTIEKYIIDPDDNLNIYGYKSINLPATEGMEIVYKKLMSNY